MHSDPLPKGRKDHGKLRPSHVTFQASTTRDQTLPAQQRSDPTFASTPEARRRIWRAIRGVGNLTTEAAFAVLLRRHGLSGWRRHQPYPGRPDFAWRREKVVVFVDAVAFGTAAPGTIGRRAQTPNSGPPRLRQIVHETDE
ncbi:MAG: hypothetical protein IT355_13220 [Gemmatimonadaceae bacterium]|nr:hypothetical protein [Gemmatimonadaceae bacterium]